MIENEGSTPLISERRGSVAWLVLARPERLNAIDEQLEADLLAALCELDEDESVLAIALTGHGSRAFSSGVDLKERAAAHSGGEAPRRPMRGRHRNLCEVVLETTKPTVAVLNGPAVGFGCELALSCDLRIAADHAFLQLPEACRGLGANVGTTLLPRLIPRALALELLYTGQRMAPDRAERAGLINLCVPAEELRSRADEMLSTIANNAPLTLRRMKETVAKGWELPVPHALRLDVGPDPYTSEDRKEGAAAFLEGRRPRWQGR